MIASARSASSSVRTRLLLTTAAAAIGFAQPAFAASDAGLGAPSGKPEAYGAPALTSVAPEAYDKPLSVAPSPYSGFVAPVAPDAQIVIANPGTPTTAQDTSGVTVNGVAGVNGVGQMIVDSGGGFLGLCTGTLINPRTVIFAAHCVNEGGAATSYGKNSGGTAIGFGFAPSNLAGVRSWFLPTVAGGAPNPLQFKTNLAAAFFNANQVVYNPGSLEPLAESFLYSDVALATLDTPASKVPTWALLFSALPATTITANGTGYHVTVTGYGANGNATTGSGGIDYRRRIAENMIGGLTNLDTFQQFLFGDAPTGLQQNLYFIDFDDPRRGLTGASPYDFNAFRDNAASANEGTTAGGDSGGPLIVDRAFSKPVIAGVLSGGYTRFYNAAPANGYGTVSFFQPLYLYWDYIVANNPYHYVSAVAGDGRWADPTHWVTTLDPNYQVITGGQLVNGLPVNPGAGKAGNTGQFGEICFQDRTSSDCLNVATGVERIDNKPIGTGANGAANDAARVETNGLTNDAARVQIAGAGSGATTVSLTSNDPAKQADGAATGVVTSAAVGQALPAATLGNGLPGATNFVPNNADGVRTTGVIGRYFDVTLGAAGTTTLDTAVTIDRFTLSNSAARLNITSAGSLTSLIDTTQVSGVTTVDGTLNSIGDYLIMGGGLMGSGRINAPFTTNVAGAIAPGTNGTIGTLTFGGNLILASASSLVIDLGSNGTSDRVNVVATNFTTTPVPNLPTNGIANLGGRVAFGLAQGAIVRNGDVFTILTAQGGTQGSFSSAGPLSAILTPNLTYAPGLGIVQARITAGSYANVVANTPVQRAYAQLLDNNRSQASGFASIYDLLDLQSAGTIQSTLEALAPRTETLKSFMGVAAVDNTSRMIRDRLTNMEPGLLGGTMAYIGRPVQTAQNALVAMPGAGGMIQSDMSGGGGTTVREGSLPETMSGFLAGGYLDGSSRPMAGAVPGGGRDKFDGFYLAGGIEGEVAEGAAIGFALSYTDLDGRTAFGAQSAKGRLYQGTIYGKANYGVVNLDAQLSGGLLSARTLRPVSIVTNSFLLRSKDDALTASGEVGLSALFGDAIKFGPRIAGRASYIGFSRIAESGGGPALTIDRNRFASVQGRGELIVKGSGHIRPFVTGAYVHDFMNQPVAFGANFVGGIGPNAIFALAGQDKDWVEVSGGLAIDTGALTLSVGADSTFARKDVRNQSYRGAVKFRF